MSSIIFSFTEQASLKAAKDLREGKLVAFPTETVYGLGGNACDDRAVAAIYEAKGRPSFNPLIVHVPDVEQARAEAVFDERAVKIAERFWPGPLTLILPRRRDGRLSLLVSAGLDTVAMRVPGHPAAQALLRKAGVPVAAPSANRSGRVSPTCARHVAEELGGRISIILDGGECPVGLESTVLDLSGEMPVILRPGSILREELEDALGPVEMASGHSDNPASPGMLKSHYAPSLPVRLNVTEPYEGEAWLGFGPVAGATLNLSEAGDVVEAASNLFAALRELDRPESYRGIAVAPIPETGLGIAINDRLQRAAADRGEPA